MKKMAEEKNFLIKGEIQEKNGKKPFSKKIKAKTAQYAAEKVLCIFGSKNKLKRNRITITETKEVENDAGKKERNKSDSTTAD